MQNANVPLQQISHYHLATYYIESLAKLWHMFFFISKIIVIQMIMLSQFSVLSILILDYHSGRLIVISYRR